MILNRKSKTPPSARSKQAKPGKKQTILEQFQAELGQEIDAKEAGVTRKLTKGQALIKSMINEALKGDQRMLGGVLKLIERLDDLIRKTEVKEDEEFDKLNWEEIFIFYGKYRSLIDQELEKRREQNADYWSFEWYHPTLGMAPWYDDLYPRK